MGKHPLGDDDTAISVVDPKIGKAAVFLYEALGVRVAYGALVSARAYDAAAQTGITLYSGNQVDSLECMTEELLKDVSDPLHARSLLESRLTDRFFEDPTMYVRPVFLNECALSTMISRYVDKA